MTKETPPVYYDTDDRASAKGGRWVLIRRGTSTVFHERFRTEFERNQAAGIRGGSKDPLYVPAQQGG